MEEQNKLAISTYGAVEGTEVTMSLSDNKKRMSLDDDKRPPIYVAQDPSSTCLRDYLIDGFTA
jgi:hypothetical protein